MALFTDATITRTQNCERRDCPNIICPGEPAFNIQDGLGQVKVTCEACYRHYKEKEKQTKQRNATYSEMRNVGTDNYSNPPLDFDTMRQNVNESQRKGGSAPGGRVTALPAPKVSAHRYRSETTTATGYSAAHEQYASQTALWSQRAYKGLTASQIGTVTINLFAFEPTFNSKGQPSMVDGIKEGIRVSSDISTRELSKSIRNALLPPLRQFCGSIQFDINKMVLRDASNGAWMRVDMYSEVPYFGNQFLKANPRKKDGGLIFHIPANMKLPTFGLVFENHVWKEVEAAHEAQIYGHSPSASPKSLGPTAVLLNAVGLRPKRKASVSSNTSSVTGSRKVARRRIASPKAAPRSARLSKPYSRKASANSTKSHSLSRKADSVQRRHHLKSDSRNDHSETENEDEEGGSEDVLSTEEIAEDGLDEEWEYERHEPEERGQVAENKDREDNVEDKVLDEDSDLEESPSRTVGSTRVSSTSQLTKGSARGGPKPPFISLSIDTIRRAFLEGGMSSKSRNQENDDFVWERILFIDLPQPTFNELITTPTKLREDMLGANAIVFEAHLRYDARPDAFLGVGSFKTTTPARLTFTGTMLPDAGLGMLIPQNQDNRAERSISVALKRPYRTKRVGGATGKGMQKEDNIELLNLSKTQQGRGIGRMPWAEEQNAVFEECKLLAWANSLLTAAYDFIDNFIDAQPTSPPFEVLRFRFVAAGMAVALKPLDTKGKNPSTSRATYILEEVLPCAKTDFVKYLHNANATPELSADDPNYGFAEFLSFIQHLQYMITGGVAYVSDFQGVGLLLTDPQILTTPQLGNDLFGDGNIGEAFDEFPKQHQCNKYCQWFELGKPLESQQELRPMTKKKGKKSSSSKAN